MALDSKTIKEEILDKDIYEANAIRAKGEYQSRKKRKNWDRIKSKNVEHSIKSKTPKIFIRFQFMCTVCNCFCNINCQFMKKRQCESDISSPITNGHYY